MAVLICALYARNERPEQVGRIKFLVAAAGKLRQQGPPRQIITMIHRTGGEYYRLSLIQCRPDKAVADQSVARTMDTRSDRAGRRSVHRTDSRHHEFAWHV